MAVNAAFTEQLNEKESREKQITKDLHRRFVMWKEDTGSSIQRIASMLDRSTTAVSQYLNKKYEGSVVALEKDIGNLLRREENLEFRDESKPFCRTNSSILIWEVLQYCDKKCKMGVALAPSGTGKTQTCDEYKRQNRATILVTAHIQTQAAGAVMRLISKTVVGDSGKRSIADMLDRVIERLKNSRRLLIIDDAHFLSWEAYELVRKIHDCAGIGVVYAGQERLYEQMRGKESKAYLFDQIYSRIAIKRSRFTIKKSDVRMIADTVCPGLDNACNDFLYRLARGKGRLRVVDNLLEMAMEIHHEFDEPLNVSLFRKAEQYLMEDHAQK